jgi:chromosome partitioning protein
MTELTVANLKGGVGKTTTAVHLGLGLSETGRTLIVDTDPARTALKWSIVADDEWPYDRCTVVSWTDPRALQKQIDSVRSDYDHIVIDVPPSRALGTSSVEAATLHAALMATGNLIVPTSSSAIDLTEIKDTFEVAAGVDLRRPVLTSVLLVRIRIGTRSADDARVFLSERHGYPVMRTVIPLRESLAQALGTVPRPLPGAYADALAEILANHTDQQEASA